jgi:hypothetical protein
MSTGAGSTKKYVFGVKIYLDTVETQNTAIGLYTRAFGAANTQFDITKTGSTVRYTYDGTGTAPAFVANDMKIGDAILIASTGGSAFNSANNGTYKIITIAETYFEVINASGVAESNKTLGSTTALQGSTRFRWIQASTANTTDTWAVGMLAEKGIGKDTRSGDFRRGGGPAKIHDCEITITNVVEIATVPTQVWQLLNAAEIYFAGLKIEIIKIDLSIAHAGTRANETIRNTGICESPKGWNETRFAIPFVNAYYKRRSNLSTVIDPNTDEYAYAEDLQKGNIVPVTFGTFRAIAYETWKDSDNSDVMEIVGDRKAKFVRSAKEERAWKTSDKLGGYEPTAAHGAYPFGTDTFPITHLGEDSLHYKFRFSSPTSGVTQDGTIANILAWIRGTWGTTNRFLYIKVVSGSGAGQYRKIDVDSANSLKLETGANPTEIIFAVESWFENALSDITGGGATQSWVQLIDVQHVFKCDVWPCGGFINRNGVLRTVDLDLYAYTEQQTSGADGESVIIKPKDFIAIPPYAYIATATNNNSFTVEPKFFSGSLDNLFGIILLPPRSIDFGSGTEWMNLVDKDFSSYINITGAAGGNSRIICRLPALPLNLKFSKMYALIRSDYNTQEWSYYLTIQTWKTLVSGSAFDPGTRMRSILFDGIPDFYYSANIPSTKNKNFFVSAPGTELWSGYMNFEVPGITSLEDYLNYSNIDFYFESYAGKVQNYFVYEIVFGFLSSMNIGDAIYAPHIGRVVNDAGGWGGKFLTTDTIHDPLMVAEHVMRLMNWSERGEEKNWGKEYAANALVNQATTEGGLYWLGLTPIRQMNLMARQLLEYDDCWSDSILESLCIQYRLCWFQNNAGEECIGSVDTVRPSLVTVNVTLADIIPGSIGDITETGPEDIFCEPIIRFNYNAATGKFDNVIQITNANASTYSSSYVTGYKGDSAEEIWNKAHALWGYYRTIEKPPSTLTDCYWISWMSEAERDIMHWFEWMGVYRSSDDAVGVYRVSPKKRIPFSVPYEIGEEWFISMHFNLSLPHQTNGAAVQCIIEKLVFDYENDRIDIVAVIVDETNKVSFYIQDTFDSFEDRGWHDWQNSVLTQAEAPSQEYDIQGAT